MKVVTVLGTRPEIIRLSRIIEKLDVCCEHTVVHTGQNYDPRLNDIFFAELGVRRPDIALSAQGTFGEQAAVIFPEIEKLLLQRRPDRFLVLGDTNSALAAVVAKRLGIPVYHMEAGNRCYDDRVPEEVNRRIIDHSSDVLMPYTERSRQNLLSEGIEGRRIYVTGNPILEVIQHHESRIAASGILGTLRLEPKKFFLVTLHRAENVDIKERLSSFTSALEQLSRDYRYPVIISAHPRTRSRMESFGMTRAAELQFLEPFGFFDFVALERNAFCVLSDSGTVQEECCIFGTPNATLRDVTERPETLECGSNILAGAEPETIIRSVALVTKSGEWTAPGEYTKRNVSETVVRILTGFR